MSGNTVIQFNGNYGHTYQLLITKQVQWNSSAILCNFVNWCI